MSRITLRRTGAVPVTLAYGLIATIMTWPLVWRISSAIAWDLGDPIFNCWVLLWTSGQVLAALGGDPGALAEFWQGNIFYPEANVLAYSEHLTPQMLMALPVLATTGNVILSYNLLFLSTFVLSGLGMYLLVRELTGSALAGFVAGLAFAWVPYRLDQLSHLQTLTSYWMPLTLFGFHRFFATRRLLPLAGGGAALVAQNLSSGYYLLFFPPFVAVYCLYEIVSRRLMTDRRTWLALGSTAVLVAALTWPFISPYLHVRELGELGVRSRGEIEGFSADAHSLATVSGNARLWQGRLNTYPRPEGQGFQGVTIVTLGLIGIGWIFQRGIRRLTDDALSAWARVTGASAAVVLAVSSSIAIVMLVRGQLALDIGGTLMIHRNITPALWTAAISGVFLIAVLTLTRPADRSSTTGPAAFALCALAASVLLAFGPTITASGRMLGVGPYQWLVTWVPGFDGARVPARFLMLVSLFLSILSGYGAAVLLAWRSRTLVRIGLGVAAAAILAESWFAPMLLNIPIGVAPGLVSPTSYTTGRQTPRIYGVVRDLPGPVVLIEFPYGEAALEIQATFYAGYHRRPVLNGYSGYSPASHRERAEAGLWDVTANPALAAATLRASGATHALVREASFSPGRGEAVSAWLLALGARPVASDGPDKLFQLK